MMGRRFRRTWFRRVKKRGRERGRSFWLPLALGLIMAFLLIRWFDAALRPQLIALSEVQIQNRLTRIANQSISQTFGDQGLSYSDMVTLQTAGTLSTLVADTASLNQLKVSVLEDIISQVESIENSSLGVPLGALTGVDILSAVGPKLPVQVISVASAEGQYRNDFSSAGINQTLHRILLDITLTAKLLLPGGVVEVRVSAPVCIAETIIVGQVPQTYVGVNK